MKILIACEESQAICKEFRKLWHEAYSCDILECSWWHPEWHIQGDAIEVAYWLTCNPIHQNWDMMIAHPPCTYLCIPSAQHLHKEEWRWEKMRKWADFFLKLWNAPIERIAIENPVPHSYAKLPKYDQIIYPYMFYDTTGKRTCFWLKNLSPIKILTKEKPYQERYIDKNWVARNLKWYANGSKSTRSKTPPWIAKAIAEQWWNKDTI